MASRSHLSIDSIGPKHGTSVRIAGITSQSLYTTHVYDFQIENNGLDYSDKHFAAVRVGNGIATLILSAGQLGRSVGATSTDPAFWTTTGMIQHADARPITDIRVAYGYYGGEGVTAYRSTMLITTDGSIFFYRDPSDNACAPYIDTIVVSYPV